jgi:hypothetical protein
MKKDKEKKASIPKICFLLAQTFSLKEKLYQKNYFLSTGSFFRKKVFCEKKKCWYRHGYVLPLLFALLFILAFASCTTVSAVCGPGACPSETKYTGTIHGGVYYRSYELLDEPPVSATFEGVPDKEKVKIAMVYTGIWRGSPGKGGTFNITVNDHTSIDYLACDPAEPEEARCDTVNETECHDYVTGCNVQFVTYNATPYIKTGTNNVTVWSDCPPAGECVCGDGRIYGIGLVVVYEDPSMPEITYWLNEGQAYMCNISGCAPDADEVYVYFNGTVYPGSVSDLKYWTMAPTACPVIYPELNGNYIGKYDIKVAPYAWESFRWNTLPPSYLNTSSNLFYYYNSAEEIRYSRIASAVLMLNYSEPGDLTVTDVSPESLCVDWYNTIDAKIVNNGGTASFFDVTLYANGDVIDVKRVTNLGDGENTTVRLFWKPSTAGSYLLNVTADAENVVLETDKTNNSKTLNVEVKVASLPEWQSQSSNVSSIPVGGTIELRAQGIADVGLDTAILATDETGSWENCTNYSSPMNMASYHNYSVTHTSDSDWNNQTKENLCVSSENVELEQILGDNIAKGDPAFASSFTYPADPSYYGPENAVDGYHGWISPHYGWLSDYGDVPCWWKVDLGAVDTDIREICIEFSKDYTRPLHYDIYTSNDNETWTLKEVRSYSDAEEDAFTGLDWSCRYINVSIIKTFHSVYPDKYGGICEFEAYGPGDYKPNGRLASNTIETDNPITSVIPIWNSDEPAGTNLSVNVSVDNGATWNTAVNGTALTWDYNGNNTKLKYKVLFETTDINETPVLHDITLNYTTKDPIEGEWLWSNFTWHNASIPNGTTVAWKIYYEDMLGQTNCTAEETFYVGEAGDAPNVVVTVHNVSFGNMLAGDNNTIYVSLTLNNTEGTASADIEAVFKTNVSEIYGLNGTGANIIPGNNFELGLDTNEKALTNTTTKTFISTVDAGAIVDYNAILIVPAGQAADDYSGIVELSW